ncbi:MAG: substrate-binding domain-containing protein [Planctomycetota bacterium]|jgi:ribose transport system permease protein
MNRNKRVASKSSGKTISYQTLQSASVFVLMIGLCLVSSVSTKTFLTWTNLIDTLLTNAACLGIIACGMTFVMVAGGFDLSVASTTAVCSVVVVLVLQLFAGANPWLAILLAVSAAALVGTVLGAFNGAVISYVGVNPFVVTLSTMLVFRGLALLLTGGGQTVSVPLSVSNTLREIYWGGIALFGVAEYRLRIPILIFLGVFLVSVYLLRLTRFGHYVYCVGGNENAAWLAGINTAFVKAATYAICGLTCAIAAVIYVPISNTAQAASYQGLELLVIASVIVGGTPLGGGSGGLLFTFNGLLLLSVIENLLGQFSVDDEWRKIVRGLIILSVCTVDVLVRRRARAGFKIQRLSLVLIVTAVVLVTGAVAVLGYQLTRGPAYEIGFCMTLDHPYWQNMRLGAIDEGKKLGANVTIMNANEDAIRQIQQIQELIAKRVDIACVVPMKKEPLVEGIKALNDANIPVIIVNREIAEGCEYLCYTGTDTYQGAVASARILAEAIGGEGEIAELHQHPGTGPEITRSKALRDVLAEYPDIKIVARVPHEGDRGIAIRETQTFLGKYPDLKGIFAQGDNFAIAAADACINAGRKNVAVVGVGGSQEAIEAIKAGKLTGTSYQRPEEEGRNAIRLAVKHLDGEKLEKSYPIECPPITKENAHKFKGQF